MNEYDEGDWHVFEEKTTKSFGHFVVDASRGLERGLSGLVTTYEWQGTTCKVSAPGAESVVTFDKGVVKCKIQMSWWVRWWVRRKILSEVKNTTLAICGCLPLTDKTVFIVHGRDHAKRGELQALLRLVGLQSIVLDEQDSMGMTIIEKLEYYGQACAFAIVLMTPDDLMMAGTRARQNVLLELGWFMAHLGRDRVLLLYSGGLEIPSDISGVVYLEFKDSVREVEGRIQQSLRGAGLIA